jgi:transposase
VIRLNDEKKEKHPGGRPTPYKEEYNRIAENACAIGATEAKLAKMLGVCKATVTNWKHDHPEFLASIKKGREFFLSEEVTKSLAKQALGYNAKEKQVTKEELTPCGMCEKDEAKCNKSKCEKKVIKATTKTTTKYQVSTTAGIFLAKNWTDLRDVKAVEHTGPDGGPIKTQNVPLDLSQLDDNELALAEKIGLITKESE